MMREVAVGGLVLAVFVIVPLGRRVLGVDGQRSGAHRIAACGFVVGLSLRPGVIALALTLPWFFACARFGVGRGVHLLRSAVAFRLEPVSEAAAGVFLAVGAGWGCIAALGWRPLGFAPITVLLTAVHFHFAGFAFGAMAIRVRRERVNRWTAVVAVGWMVGVPLVALGITTSSLIEPIGAVTLATTGGLLGLLVVERSVRHRSGWLAVSGASLCFAMVLAAGYALAQQFGFRWLDLEMMERIHGMANAFGFALCGLIGWSRIDRIMSREDKPLCVSP